MKSALAFAFAVLLLSVLCPAQTFTVLHTFTGQNDGNAPIGGVTIDSNGNLYGTTLGGYSGTGKNGIGTLYKIDTAGVESTLHFFTGLDGTRPGSNLLLDDSGNLYGTTTAGGAGHAGTLFRVASDSGKFQRLYAFETAGIPGERPLGGVTRDGEGNLYGTTSAGGLLSNGTVYRIDHASGAYTRLHSFGNQPDGEGPVGDLLLASDGNLYGAAGGGGAYGWGAIYKITPSGAESVIYSFNGDDGANPYSTLIQLADGNLYGTTFRGGAFQTGVLFKLSLSGNLTVLHTFNADPSNGTNPYAGVTPAPNGEIYGTTSSGGAHRAGTVYKLDQSGVFTILHSFQNTDGRNPQAAVTLDSQGNLYGTTELGGDPLCHCGVVYKITLTSGAH